MDFEEYLGKALEEMEERNERVIKQFFWKIGYKGIIGYKNSLGENKFTIWTDNPGVLIGRCGKNVDILKDVLKKEFNSNYDVEFKEIRGKMLVIV